MDIQLIVKALKRSLPVISLLFFMLPSTLNAQAFCALRDPAEAIQKLYPQSSTYRSVVRTIDESVRQEVSAKVPPHALHFSELGRHTLYMVFQGDNPMGYVHVRSEQSEWGLVEIAWAIDMDMKIADFTFQRCRNRYKSTIESDSFKNQIKGKDFEQMKALLVAEQFTLRTDALVVEPKAVPLAQVLVRCGIKTLLVTELAWREEIVKNELLDTARSSFSNTVDIEMVSRPVTTQVLSSLNNEFDGASPGIDRSSVSLAKVLDDSGAILGAMYRGEVNIDRKKSAIIWAVAPDGEVINIVNRSGWQQNATKQAFESNVGKKFTTGTQCSDRTQLTTMEAVLTAQPIFVVN